MSAIYSVFLLAYAVQVCHFVDCEFVGLGGGMLYPYESESRQTQLLDGMWNFRADTSDCRCEGLVQRWYLKPLSEVNNFTVLIDLQFRHRSVYSHESDGRVRQRAFAILTMANQKPVSSHCSRTVVFVWLWRWLAPSPVYPN